MRRMQEQFAFEKKEYYSSGVTVAVDAMMLPCFWFYGFSGLLKVVGGLEVVGVGAISSKWRKRQMLLRAISNLLVESPQNKVMAGELTLRLQI